MVRHRMGRMGATMGEQGEKAGKHCRRSEELRCILKSVALGGEGQQA